jgi:AcrR family transcriptional regulator
MEITELFDMVRTVKSPSQKTVLRQSKTKNLIAGAAAKLFSTRGYLATSIDDIAEAARISKGKAYYYFKSKSEILHFVCSKYVELDLENLEGSLKLKQNALEKIRFIIDHHINHYTTNTFAAKTLIKEAYSLPKEYLKDVKAMERQYFEITANVISEFLGVNERKEIVTTLTFTLYGMMNWIYSWYDPKGKVKPKELSNLIFRIFTSGIRYGIFR